MACPENSCRKKVILRKRDNTYDCQNCNNVYERWDPTYMINGYITDGIENTKVTFYKDQGVQVFNGFPAEKMNTLLEYEDSEQAAQIFEEAMYKPFMMTIWARMDESRSTLKYSATRIERVDYDEVNQNIIDRLKIYTNKNR